MSPVTQCLECGADIPADAQGLCPKCLLKLGLASQFGSASIADAGARAPVAPPRMPFDFGEYRVLRLLGRGGMGAVYEAEQRTTGRRVALKVLGHTIDSPEMRKRFLREGRLAAAVNHPNSVYIYGTEEIDETPVIAMELVPGGTLKDEVKRRGPLPVRDAVDAILHIAMGLEAAQAGGVLHRDVKPANCFVAVDGAVKVGDFGLSVSTLARADSQLTASGVMLGTPSFAPPEQLRGDDLDARADIYSVGATLYYLLSTHAPHEGDNVVNVVASVLDKTPEPLTKYRQDVPVGVSQIVSRCLAKKREDRFPDYKALREALLPFSTHVPEPAPLRMRFVAGLADSVLAALPEITLGAVLRVEKDFNDYLLGERTGHSLLLWSIMMLVYLAYTAVPEGLWGASAGKALCGLRVVGANGAAPGIGRAFVRSVIWNFAFIFGHLLALFFMTAEEFRQDDGGWFQFVFIPALVALFATARRNNGFAALQDLASGTRVVLRSRTVVRPRLSVSPFSVPPAEAQRVGPYLAGVPVAGGTMLAAYDDVLRRHVWIRLQSTNAEPLSEARRGLDRATRLRWIGGVRSDRADWDAYEAPSGKPLLALVPASQPWDAVRHWLHDLAMEIDSAAKDGTLPPAVGLENVWLTQDGHAVLLEEPWPVSTTDDKDEGRRPTLSVAEFATAEPAAAQRFLDAVASRALDRSLLPLHARDFLHKLAAGAFDRASFVAGNLQSLIAKPATVSRGQRFASLALAPAIFAVFAVAAGIVLNIEKHRREVVGREHPEILQLSSDVLIYGVMRGDAETFVVFPKPGHVPEETISSIARIISARHHDLIADPEFATKTKGILDDHERELALRVLRKYPEVSPSQLKRAETIAGIYLDRDDPVYASIPMFIVTVLAGCIVIAAIVNFSSILAFGTSPGLRLFGLAVVRKAGEPAGRLRLVARWFAAWTLFFAFLILLVIANETGEWKTGHLVASAALLLASLAGLVEAVRKPARGPHDILAGTRLVPR